MAAALVAPPPGPVVTSLNYSLEVKDGGYDHYYPATASAALRKHDPRQVTIQDLRQSTETFNLDRAGFQVVKSPPSIKGIETYSDDTTLKEKAYGDAIGILKKVTGATRVEVFSHILRKHNYNEVVNDAKQAKDVSDVVPKSTSARFCHVDQSYDGAITALNGCLTEDEASRLSKTRWAIINVWRPISAVVQREPLAVCDARSVSDVHLRPVGAVPPAREAFMAKSGSANFNHNLSATAEIWTCVYAEGHRWWYASGMTEDEVMLIKCFDSKTSGGVARRTLHTAFEYPGQSEEVEARMSVELRCLVFWEDQQAE